MRHMLLYNIHYYTILHYCSDCFAYDGKKCMFPFKYDGKLYKRCVPPVWGSLGGPWCATKLNEELEYEKWDRCANTSCYQASQIPYQGSYSNIFKCQYSIK